MPRSENWSRNKSEISSPKTRNPSSRWVAFCPKASSWSYPLPETQNRRSEACCFAICPTNTFADPAARGRAKFTNHPRRSVDRQGPGFGVCSRQGELQNGGSWRVIGSYFGSFIALLNAATAASFFRFRGFSVCVFDPKSVFSSHFVAIAKHFVVFVKLKFLLMS